MAFGVEMKKASKVAGLLGVGRSFTQRLLYVRSNRLSTKKGKRGVRFLSPIQSALWGPWGENGTAEVLLTQMTMSPELI